jgi:hypothetical protein
VTIALTLLVGMLMGAAAFAIRDIAAARERTERERFARVVGSAVERPRERKVVSIDEARRLRTKGVA